MLRIIVVSLCLVAIPAQAEEIDLNCQALAKDIVTQLSKEGLLANRENNTERALAISLKLCAGTQATVQKQVDTTLERVIKEISILGTEDRKEGNQRLLRLKK